MQPSEPLIDARDPAIGIDLGTTNSLVAALDPGSRPFTLRNAEGELVTPSAVFIGEDGALVGKEAIAQAMAAPERFADSFKRDMGRALYRRAVNGVQVAPEVLSALVLERLREQARLRLGNGSKVVITVPAYFDELRRKATQDAGRLAGWEVLDIINEPIAAALSSAYERGLFSISRATSAIHERLLVYDLGGGTFDVSLLEVEAANLRTLATDGDVQLGGRDFDERLVDYLAEQFFTAHGLDPRSDARDCFRLWQDAREAKHALTEARSATVACLHAGIQMRINVTRELFENLTRDLLERTRETADLLVRQAGLAWKDIDRVLLSGGAARMPMVSQMLMDLTGKPPDTSLSPEEAVSHGAAIFAGMILGYPALDRRPNCQLINVNSHSLGVVAVDERIQQRVNAVIIPRNTPIPAEVSRSFRTHRDGQRNVAVAVLEGESEWPDFCVPLGKCVVHDLPADLPRGTPIEVRYSYLSNGRLAVSACLPETGHSAGVEIVRDHALMARDLAAWKAELIGRPQLVLEAERRASAAGEDSEVRLRVIRQIDTLYEKMGRLALQMSVPAQLAASQRAAQRALEDLRQAERAAVEAQRHYEATVGTADAIQLGVELSRARLAQHRASDDLAFAYLVLGRDCASAGYCPPGAEYDLEEIRRLRGQL